MNLRDIDLNLLVVFHQLLLERSVSASADKLGLTQPAISNALKRLRALMGDELFVRTAKGMVPTSHALQLAEPVAYALNTLQSALSQRHDFDPSSSTRTFTISMTDIGEIYFMPPLMEMLSQRAPKVRISTVRNNSVSLKEAMEAGTVDVATGLLPHLQTGFFQRRLFRQRYVCLYRQGHPVASRAPLTLETFSQLQHVGIVSPHTGHGEVDALLERSGIQRDLKLVVPHFIAVGHIVQTTDLIATVPERFAARVEPSLGLASCPHPVALPEISINLFWHAKFNRDPANIWLRQLFFELFSD